MQNYDNAHILSLPLLVNSQINLINNYPFIILAIFFVILTNFFLSYSQILFCHTCKFITSVLEMGFTFFRQGFPG